VLRLAEAKADALWQRLPAGDRRPVLAADTTVALEGEIFGKPAELYTRQLLAAVPRLGAHAGTTAPPRVTDAQIPTLPAATVLDVSGLSVTYAAKAGWFGAAKPSAPSVDNVSFSIKAGQTLGLVGESGSGKSTTGKAVLNLIPFAGSVAIDGEQVHGLSARAMRPIRRSAQMIFQDPYASLDPRMSVGAAIIEPLVIHEIGNASERQDRLANLLRRVGLTPDAATRYPHEFSGGQRQRIAIARALALEPSLVICDEPVSALDVSIQAQVINVLMELQQRLGLSYLFVAHDLAVVRHISQRIAVMYLGRIVEIAERDALFREPLHPYTQALLSAVPVADPQAEAQRERQVLRGEVPSVMRPPSGCHFHPRCPRAMPVCAQQMPELAEMGSGRAVACHLHRPVAQPAAG